MTTLTIATIAKPQEWRNADLAAAINAGFAQLARAAVLRAVKDAAAVDLPPDSSEVKRADIQAEAQDWLTSADGVWMVEACGFDPLAVRAWVRAGCPYDKKQIRAIATKAARTVAETTTETGV